MTTVADRRALLERACAADRAIRALNQVVTALCVAAATGDGPACSSCIWERIVKPLATPLVGWERGYPASEAKDPTSGLAVVDLGPALKWLDERDAHRTPATTETERWLRSQEAWDAVTGEWISRLYEADPGAGHGIGYLSARDA